MRILVIALWNVVLWVGLATATLAVEPISPKAAKLAAFYDSLNVEALWPAGVHVNWETGVPDGRPEKTTGKHTHCSAFVASAAKQLGVYILRPPEHSQVLLANAQFDWLDGPGEASEGWTAVPDATAAQAAANRGYFVVAVYHNARDDKPGHIAIVRPGTKPAEALASEGPDVIQAGGHNYTSVPLIKGFAGHPRAWREQLVRYYAHAVELP